VQTVEHSEKPAKNKPAPSKQSAGKQGQDKEETNKVGRPAAYSEELAERICEHVANGGFVSQLQKKGLPSHTTISRWLNEKEEFSAMFARAREQRAETFADQIVEIADTEEDAAKARVRVDARKFVASKLLPRTYGDKQEVNINQTVSIAHAEALMMLANRAREAKQLESPIIELEARRFVDPLPSEEDQ
jgi:hypothetical protein